MPDDELVRLPVLIAGILGDLNLALTRVNADTLERLPFAEGGTFRMDDAYVEMRGRAVKAEAGGILFFSMEQEEKGAEFFIRLPVKVEHPPEGFPWELGTGLQVFDPKRRKRIYRAAIKAIGSIGWPEMGRAPIFRTAPGVYLIIVPGDTLRAARVTREGNGWTGTSVEDLDTLWGLLGPLAEKMAVSIEKAIGRITK